MTDKKDKLVVQSLTLLQLLNANGSDDFNYFIPMYQRTYAWGKSEIETLIKDMIDAYQKASTTPYYLGTLVVFKRDDKRLEVIDGQQRLTTLILLAIYLKHSTAVNSITIENSSTEGSSIENTTTFKLKDYTQVNISFESRPESIRTLEALNNTPLDNRLNITDSGEDSINLAILNGYYTITDVIKEQFNTDNKATLNLQSFCNYLFNKVKIAQVPVPEETDLNHYFEVMNNRGEQLEKHEIIKARLLTIFSDEISDEEERYAASHLLHTVWEACANINKYVQYGFNTSSRTAIFSESWSNFVPSNPDNLFQLFQQASAEDYKKDKIASHSNESNTGFELDTILFDTKFILPADPKKGNNSRDDDSEIYYSLVNFPNFLLHVLRIMLNIEGRAVDISLDDKQLLPQFEEYIIGRDITDPLNKAKQLTYALLKTKFLFDNYVIKRKPLENKHWSLEKIENRKINNKNNPSFVKTFDSNIDSRLTMVQSAFHVSAPTMNYKHWLSASLYYIYRHYKNDGTGIDSSAYLNHLEGIARAFMLRRYLANDPDDYYTIIYKNENLEHIALKSYHSHDDLQARSAQIRQLLRFGRIRNNFVFNYLDYLIYLNDRNTDFVFTARSSVEHFYPQNKRNDIVFKDDKNPDTSLLHSFGNLCLISHSLNSRVSNDMPDVKVKYFLESKKIDSLKLSRMIHCIDGKEAKWDKAMIAQHENQMLKILMQGLKLVSEDTHK